MNSLLIVLVALFIIGIILALILRVSSLLGVLKSSDDDKASTSNKVNAVMMVLFGIVFLGSIGWYTFAKSDKYLQPVASEIGIEIDNLFMTSTYFIGFIFVLTQILLFYFAWKYQYKPGKQDNGEHHAKYYPDNNKLEIAWTVVPAIVLVILVFGGLITWRKATSEAPEGSNQVEIVGQQFGWYARYAGKDGVLGKADYRKIDEVNGLGIDFSDPQSIDDFIPLELHLEKGKTTEINIRSKDVLHSVSLPHFRMKMDAVPGLPTRYWVKPTKTTAEMRAENPEKFKDFELVCQQICGRGHFSMRLKVVVDEPEDYKKWIAEQQTFLEQNEDYVVKLPKQAQTLAYKALNEKQISKK